MHAAQTCLFACETTVLVAEDSRINRRLIRVLLESTGVRADVFPNGIDAVAAFARTRYQLVLLDCLMPGMDGFAAAREIRRIEQMRGHGRVPIIAVTAFTPPHFHVRCQRAGMDGCLVKPLHRAMIDNLLHDHLPLLET